MSENEVVVKSGQTVVFDGVEWDVRSENATTVFFDFITEGRVVNGVPYLSLGTASVDFSNKPVIDVHTRLRMDLVTAQILHAQLGDLIARAQTPPDKSVAN